MKHESLVKSYGLEDPRYKLRYNDMIAVMLGKIKNKLAREFRFILEDMKKRYYLEGKIHLTDGIKRIILRTRQNDGYHGQKHH